MGLRSGMKKLGKNLANVHAWTDTSRVVENTKTLGGTIKRLFVPGQKQREESLQQACKRLNLKEADLQQRQKDFLRLAIIAATVMGAVLLYALFLLFSGHFKGAAVGLGVTAIAAAVTFRYHFWHFQLKQGKLGCTFKEWLHKGLLRR